MRAVLLMCLIFMLFQGSVHATTNWYQPAGVITFEYSNGSNTEAEFTPLAKDRYFASLDDCNAYIASQNTLIPDGTSAPNGGNNIKQHADGLCHAVLPYQSYGWHALGDQVLRQTGRTGKSIPLDVGPFETETSCKNAIIAQRKLTVQNGPGSNQNIGYLTLAVCKYTY